MKSSINKENYLKIYQDLDTVSPIDYDCGTLCNSVCCICDDENTKDKDMVIYLLPGEEEVFLDNIGEFKLKTKEKCKTPIKKENWFEIAKENTKYYEYPKSWSGDVFFIRCKTPPTCNRKFRPIQCRTFPLTPHIINSELYLIYELNESTYICPLIKENVKLNPDFIEKTYSTWKSLIKDKLIYDLVKMDSEIRDNEKIEYKIIK